MNSPIDQFLRQLYADKETRYTFQAKSKAEWQSWQEKLRLKTHQALGLDRLQLPPQGLDPQRAESVDCGTYQRERHALHFAPGLSLPVHLLLPKGRPQKAPAIVACHGHGYGAREILGLTAGGSPRQSDPGYQKDFALRLAQRGFIVVVPELAGFGEARCESALLQGNHDDNTCHAISTALLMHGMTMAGLRVWQARCSLDFLLQRDDVDPDRVGCMGISGGGLVCSFFAALDERIHAAVISGYANTFKDSILSVHHCVDNYVPGMLNLAEMPDFISLIAPRPLLIEGGKQDPIFPIKASRQAAEAIRRVYRLLDQEDRFQEDFFAGDHQIGGEKAYPWLERWLETSD